MVCRVILTKSCDSSDYAESNPLTSAYMRKSEDTLTSKVTMISKFHYKRHVHRIASKS